MKFCPNKQLLEILFSIEPTSGGLIGGDNVSFPLPSADEVAPLLNGIAQVDANTEEAAESKADGQV